MMLQQKSLVYFFRELDVVYAKFLVTFSIQFPAQNKLIVCDVSVEQKLALNLTLFVFIRELFVALSILPVDEFPNVEVSFLAALPAEAEHQGL